MKFSKKIMDSIKINLVRLKKERKKMESNAVNGLIVPKRKMINAFNLFSAIYSRKHLFGKNLSVLMYSRLECLLSEPEHLPLLLG